jgi:hypothetical protein
MGVKNWRVSWTVDAGDRTRQTRILSQWINQLKDAGHLDENIQEKRNIKGNIWENEDAPVRPEARSPWMHTVRFNRKTPHTVLCAR